jgi:hypothetical protein
MRAKLVGAIETLDEEHIVTRQLRATKDGWYGTSLPKAKMSVSLPKGVGYMTALVKKISCTNPLMVAIPSMRYTSHGFCGRS